MSQDERVANIYNDRTLSAGAKEILRAVHLGDIDSAELAKLIDANSVAAAEVILYFRQTAPPPGGGGPFSTPR
jgi:hypothetical protein